MSTKKVTITREAAAEAAATYRDAAGKKAKIESDIRTKQSAIAAKYDRELNDLDLAQGEALQALNAYADQERDELLPGKAKSCDFVGIKIGYKSNPAKLVPVGRQTLDGVLAILQEDEDMRKQYVTIKESVDKTALKKADAATLKSLKLKLVKEETFFAKLP